MQEPPTSTLLRPPARGMDGAASNGTPGGVRPARPKLKKLRLALILLGLGIVALVSTVFGMMMAVASDLPALENQAEYRSAKNSVLLPERGNTPLARLAGNENRILVGESDISANIKNAVIAVEDRRFYEHEGVDYKGIARAFVQDVLRRRAAQGGSTITQQFVKNALSAQGKRSVFQKLREAALAYHLEREWSKSKVLTQYLNTIYFGNGAYGVESAVRTYFGGSDDARVGERAARDVTPAQAALLAGLIASPTTYDPIENRRRAEQRRNHVLERMLDQRMITRAEYEDALDEPVPSEDDIHPPRPDSQQPYFSSWLTQQLVDRYGPGLVFGGGLKIRTTIDPALQEAAEQAISRRLAGVGPDAALVAIENKTGAVKAMVGGEDFSRVPFNLATNGHRQPGSAFKPFTLVAALESGVSPDATFASHKKALPMPGSPRDKFVVRNYEDQYAGVASLRSATATSDNSVYAELGLKVGPRRIARLARRTGVRTPISTNPAMTLGGLKQGVTPLELAYAYSTIANKGLRVSGTLASSPGGPVAIREVRGSGLERRNEALRKRVFPEPVGEVAHQLLAGVVQGGTGRAARLDEFAAGKTGTTENYGDAWFVGFNRELTVAVWVGYADRLRPMETEYRGRPVAGGTYPAEIWRDFLTAWAGIREARDAAHGKDEDPEGEEPPTAAPTPPAVPAAPSRPPAPPTAPPVETTGAEDGKPKAAAPSESPTPRPAPPKPAPTPQRAPPPSTEGGSGDGAVEAPE